MILYAGKKIPQLREYFLFEKLPFRSTSVRVQRWSEVSSTIKRREEGRNRRRCTGAVIMYGVARFEAA